MSRQLSFASLLCFVCVSAFAFASDKETADLDKINELQKKHLAVCKDRLLLFRQAYAEGIDAVSGMLRVHGEYVDAELALAAPDRHSVVLEKAVRWTNDIQQQLQQRVDAGGGSPREVLEAQACHLKFQIRLAKLRP